MKAIIIRVEESEEGTIGVMVINGQAFCCTLEPPDKDNQQNISCIPAGTYTAKRVLSPKYGNTFEIDGVEGRDHILFHAGNVVEHTKGCVLLGQYFGKLKGDRAVLNSGTTFRSFMNMAGDARSFDLEVKEVM